MTRAMLYILLGAIAFVAITYFEQLPVLGWIGAEISVAAWIVLTRELLSDSQDDVIRSGLAVPWAAVLGAITGFVGAFTAWLAQTGNLVGLGTLPGDRVGAAFGFIGALLGIVYWPIIGALVCGGTAIVITGRRVNQLRREE